jgi:hypothetical protein
MMHVITQFVALLMVYLHHLVPKKNDEEYLVRRSIMKAVPPDYHEFHQRRHNWSIFGIVLTKNNIYAHRPFG